MSTGPRPTGHGLDCHNHSALRLGEGYGLDFYRRTPTPQAIEAKRKALTEAIADHRRRSELHQHIVETQKTLSEGVAAARKFKDQGLDRTFGLSADDVRRIAAKLCPQKKGTS